jgi:hypothetical protein
MFLGGVRKFRGSLLYMWISARGSLFSGFFELSALISAFKGEFFDSGGVSAFSAVL